MQGYHSQCVLGPVMLGSNPIPNNVTIWAHFQCGQPGAMLARGHIKKLPAWLVLLLGL